MKPLDQLNNVERAKLLHELFPQEIPRLLEFTGELCRIIQDDREQLAQAWEHQILPLDMWIGLAGETAVKIEKYGSKMHRSSRLFADQLFDGYAALFLSHCLHQYTKVRRCEDAKFTAAADLFFMYHPNGK